MKLNGRENDRDRLSLLPIEMKVFVSATLIFALVALAMALLYIYVSHRGPGSGLLLTPKEIAATYYGPGVGLATLIGLAHIHLWGLLVVFWVIGFIFLHSGVPRRWKMILSVLPYVAFLFDVAGWFLTTLDERFVYVVLIGGATFTTALFVMIFCSLWDLWFSQRSWR